ncbi:MAG: RNA-directed DNA polymerase [Planctomycetaceae bacterium]|nr:RNA-directed DNA polymerase [Planctomycetaceae bacterium]
MGFLSWLLWGSGKSVGDLAEWLGVDVRQLKRLKPEYREFTIPKRSGGVRRIAAPSDELKRMQRRIGRRLLRGLRAHEAAHGFERNRSIVTNARVHCGQDVVVRMDLVDFFPSTSARRVHRYFRRIGWNRPAARLLTRLCTHEGGLPQGAPTSPRLSNLVNYRLDARIAGLVAALGGRYTRYADDLTISFAAEDAEDDWVIRSGPALPFVLEGHPEKIRYLRSFIRRVAGQEGYRVHRRKKTSVRRRHHRQMVTGLVVNEVVNLPRETRRRLRAIAHRAEQQKRPLLDADYRPFSYGRRQPTLTPAQLEGWEALQAMIVRQRVE